MHAPPTPRSRAVVLGGGMTGMLAAHALAEVADVTVIEDDVLPEGPEPRRGLPQARHAHLLWSGGVRALDELLPGIVDRLVDRGARRVPIMSGLVSKAPSGQWFRRFAHAQHTNLVCSRDLLDAVIRTAVLRNPRITLHPRTRAVGLEGSASRVTGVRVESVVRDGAGVRDGSGVHDGAGVHDRSGVPDKPEAGAGAGAGAGARAGVETLAADLVIDACGRASRTPQWLRALGLPAVDERVVDAGVGYASRLYRAPGSTASIPIVNVQADPRQAPGRGGIILPIEHGRLLVTLSGTAGGRPTADNDAFVPFALTLQHPLIGELLAHAEPLTDVVTSHSTANRRRYYERARMPGGFAVLGDALAGYNPVYGHGLTAAAQGAVALRDTLRRHPLPAPGTARVIQRAVARPVGHAWDLAVGQDAGYPGATDQPPSRIEQLTARYLDRVVDTGARNPYALRILLDVMSMQAPPTRLLRPDMLRLVLTGRKKPLLDAPPLTAEERSAITRARPPVHEGEGRAAH
ncbi:pyridine nucleotide-disulfide oxidoreductase [Streptomyces triticagri]|uniref:Pyridine nucleotide-disulfide oxidoreductase n=1 Tax=Streptomyces triticagri TaxID=2293568 RepID=A0A372M7B3_9ACTN|nr:pyridine nucleotide-disulfide oxidoreductase [Streptomyces triticagri]RFU86832.1 pyridine nucleotide-disulfide oxidoreductase [Streptomyces triticagri]